MSCLKVGGKLKKVAVAVEWKLSHARIDTLVGRTASMPSIYPLLSQEKFDIS